MERRGRPLQPKAWVPLFDLSHSGLSQPNCKHTHQIWINIFKGSGKHCSLWKLWARKSEWIHPSWLKQSTRDAAQGCFAERGYSQLSASFTPEWRTPGNPPSAKHSSFYFQEIVTHLTPMTYNSRAMSHCPAIITVTFTGTEVSFPQGPAPKYHPADRRSCQNVKIHHTDRLSLRTPRAWGFEQSILYTQNEGGANF